MAPLFTDSLSFWQIVLVAVVSGGIGGAVVSGLFKLAEQRHAHRLERRRKMREERKEIYPQVLDQVSRTRQGIEQYQRRGQHPGNLVLLDEDERRKLILSLSALGSREVNELVQRFSDAAVRHVFDLQQHRQALEQGAGAVMVGDVWKRAEASRGEMDRLAVELQAQVRKELAKL